MFSYYGSKSKLVSYYPYPKYPLIIEPFAGSAKYSLFHNDKEVIVNDKYRVVYEIWDYLVYKCTLDQVNQWPELKKGDDLRNFKLSQVEKWLLGFNVSYGLAHPNHIYTGYAAESGGVRQLKNNIRNFLPRIRHWTPTNESYEKLNNEDATWFIDPPYKVGGEYYVENKINYKHLADWCRSRKGQVIVCENSNADWLPFRAFKESQSVKGTTCEMIWTN